MLLLCSTLRQRDSLNLGGLFSACLCRSGYAQAGTRLWQVEARGGQYSKSQSETNGIEFGAFSGSKELVQVIVEKKIYPVKTKLHA